MLQGIKTTRDGIEIDGVKYKHYTHNGKYKSNAWVVWDGVHYYNHSNGLGVEE